MKFNRADATLADGVSEEPVAKSFLQRLFAPNDAMFRALFVSWLIIIFFLGGSARSDVAVLMVLRPLAVLMFACAFILSPEGFMRRHAAILLWAVAVLALPLVQSIPLPPGVWQSLPARELIVEIDTWAGLADIWRPLTLDPAATVNAFWSLFVPISVFWLALIAGVEGQRYVLGAILVLGGVSALLGLAQVLGPPDSQLYPYSVSNRGAAVGLFANRNHQAFLLACLVPAMFLHARASSRQEFHGASLRRQVPWWALPSCLSLVLIPLLLVTGSRAGVFLFLLACGSTPWILSPFRRAAGRPYRAVVLLIIWTLMITTAILLDRDLALERLVSTRWSDDSRALIAPVILSLIGQAWPTGTGLGSFLKVYLTAEPDVQLSATYMNHAHNDWLELLLTGGAPACFVVMWGLAIVGKGSLRGLRGHNQNESSVAAGRFAALVILLAAVHSLVDYPLRVPIISSLMAISVAWCVITPRNIIAKSNGISEEI